MAYTFEQFERDHFLRKIPKMLQDEETESSVLDTFLKNLSLDRLISRLLDNKRLRQIFIKKFNARLSTDERLEGLPPDEIKVYLRQIESKN